MRSKIFCLTSRWEGFPNVLTEAGFFRNYIITTDLPSARDVVDNGRIGDFFPIENSEQLAQILEKRLRNASYLEEKSLQQRERILDKFNWEGICRQIYNILEG